MHGLRVTMVTKKRRARQGQGSCGAQIGYSNNDEHKHKMFRTTCSSTTGSRVYYR